MSHTRAISAAFQDPLFQQFIGTAIERVPEIKHEGLICTALAAILRGGPSQARREVKQDNTRRGRRFDLSFSSDRTTLEAKYHLEFDLPSVSSALRNYTQIKAEILRRNRHGSWNAGEAVVYELSRVTGSYFLWTVCSRGSSPPNGVCMERSSRRWLAQLPEAASVDVHAHVESEVRRLSSALAQKESLSATSLCPIRQGHSAIFSVLFHPPVRMSREATASDDA